MESDERQQGNGHDSKADTVGRRGIDITASWLGRRNHDLGDDIMAWATAYARRHGDDELTCEISSARRRQERNEWKSRRCEDEDEDEAKETKKVECDDEHRKTS